MNFCGLFGGFVMLFFENKKLLRVLKIMLSVMSVKVVYLMIIFFFCLGNSWIKVCICVSYRKVLDMRWMILSLVLFMICICSLFELVMFYFYCF